MVEARFLAISINSSRASRVVDSSRPEVTREFHEVLASDIELVPAHEGREMGGGLVEPDMRCYTCLQLAPTSRIMHHAPLA